MVTRWFLGRDEAITTIGSSIAAVQAGRGCLVLISGEQGIGKTTLVERSVNEAEAAGLHCLVATSDSIGAQSPFGLWTQILEQARTTDALARHRPSRTDSHLGELRERRSVAAQIASTLLAMSENGPLFIVLDDLHLADRESLDVLVALARRIRSNPILIIACCRDDLPRSANHLAEHLSTLLRLPDTRRIPLRRLPADALATLVKSSYHLTPRDQRRLLNYLEEHSDGNPLVATEILHELEVDAVLLPPRVVDELWTLTDFPPRIAPPVLQDLVARRLDSLDDDVRQALGIAAVLGQEIDVDLWRELARLSDRELDRIIEQTVASLILVERGSGYRFRHPSVPDSLIDDVVLPRRRRLHRQIGETLAANRSIDPHIVAHHFAMARDPRAVEWLLQAAAQAESAGAWLTAAERYETAVAMLIDDEREHGAEILASVLYRLALVTRYADPLRARTWLDEALQAARATGEHGVAAGVLHHRGLLRCWVGEIESGLREMEQGVAEIEALGDEDYAALTRIVDFGDRARGEHRGTLIDWYSDVGRFEDALRDGWILADGTPAFPDDDQQLVRISPPGDRLSGVAGTLAWAGRYDEATAVYTAAQEYFREIGHHQAVGWMYVEMLEHIAIPTMSDCPRRLDALAAAAVRAWEHSSPSLFDAYPRVATLPLLYLRGEWGEAQELGRLCRVARAGHESFLDPRPILAAISLHTGNRVEAEAWIRDLLPEGIATRTGTHPFADVVHALRLGAILALDVEDLHMASRWIDVYERWVDWSGAHALDASISLLRARLERQSGNLDQAWQHAQAGHNRAQDLGRLLDTLVAERELGEIALQTGNSTSAESNFTEALRRAQSLDAPHELALTLLGIAQLRAAQRRNLEAHAAASEARLIAARLGAAPLIDQANSIAASAIATDSSADRDGSPAWMSRLSPKELQVLQRLVRGDTTRQIARDLDISLRTAERHISNVYLKLDVTQRSQAIALAIQHGIT